MLLEYMEGQYETDVYAVAKFKRLIGDKMYADVMALHEADIKAKMAPAEETK